MNTGKQGEALFKQIMQDKGYQVQDVSDNPDYWSKDIDFVITSPFTGETKTFECIYEIRTHVQSDMTAVLLKKVSKRASQYWSVR